jgi:ATP-dependent DNA helicase RecQ
MADEQNVPPYVIFSDASLKDMSTYFPQTKEQFFEMHGVGEEKLKKYGPLFLDEIISYCKPLDIDPIPKNPSRKKKTSTVGSDTVAITLELFQQGKTVAEIAKQRGFTEETIHKHLQQAYLKGASIDVATFVSSAKQEAIIIAFDRLGIERLGPIKEFLGENYSYSELRWVQTKLLKDQANGVGST